MNLIEFEVENKTVTPIQDIETTKPLTKKFPVRLLKLNMLARKCSIRFIIFISSINIT